MTMEAGEDWNPGQAVALAGDGAHFATSDEVGFPSRSRSASACASFIERQYSMSAIKPRRHQISRA